MVTAAYFTNDIPADVLARLRAELPLSALIADVVQRTGEDDPSHDRFHVARVFRNGVYLAVEEKADLQVVVPATLYHDVVNYPKLDSRANDASLESARVAGPFLARLAGYPRAKIGLVATCIQECSFAKNIMPQTLEGKIVQDADLLESVGAHAIMRTFCSTGQYKRPFYSSFDPFCETRTPTRDYTLDLFYTRLLKVEGRLHTETAKNMARARVAFLQEFLDQVESEINQPWERSECQSTGDR
jgi:uncharacterized protein